MKHTNYLRGLFASLAILLASSVSWAAPHAVEDVFQANGVYFKITDLATEWEAGKVIIINPENVKETDTWDHDGDGYTPKVPIEPSHGLESHIYKTPNVKPTGEITIPELVSDENADDTEKGFKYQVTEVGYAAFAYCKEITSIELPGSITKVGGYAFYDCDGLTKLTFKATTVPTFGTDVLGSVDLSNVSLNTPKGVDYTTTIPSLATASKTEIEVVNVNVSAEKVDATPLTLGTKVQYAYNYTGLEVNKDSATFYTTPVLTNIKLVKWEVRDASNNIISTINVDYSNGAVDKKQSFTWKPTTATGAPFKVVAVYDEVVKLTIDAYPTEAVDATSLSDLQTKFAVEYPKGSTIKLNATALTPEDGYEFKWWKASDGTTTSHFLTDGVTVTMDGAKTYTAVFEKAEYPVVISAKAPEMGTVEITDDMLAIGEKTKVKAVPATGYKFDKWELTGFTPADPAVAEIEVEMGTDKKISGNALFKAEQYTVKSTATTGGKITTTNAANPVATDEATVAYHTNFFVNAIPDAGYVIEKWTIDGKDIASNETSHSFLVEKAADVTVTFKAVEYAVNVAADVAAFGTATTDKTTAKYGETVNITATPAVGHHFVRWSDGVVDAERNNITVKGDINLVAIFDTNTLYVEAKAENAEMGQVNGGNKVVAFEGTATLYAVPAYGYVFDKWTVDVEDQLGADGTTVISPAHSAEITDNPKTTTVRANEHWTAKFKKAEYTITTSATKGTVAASTLKAEYLSVVHLTATPDEGYHFVKWSDGSTNADYDILVQGDVNLTAEFAINKYSVSAKADDAAQGAVLADPTAATVEFGTAVKFTAQPETGYHFVRWNNGLTENPLTVNVKDNVDLVAEFAINEYTLTTTVLATPEMGSVEGNKGTYKYGETANLTAKPATGYRHVGWTLDGSAEGIGVMSLDMKADHKVVANFEPIEYTITVSTPDATKGTVSGGGKFDFHKTVKLVATPADHYHFVKWSDGVTNASREFLVQEDVTLTAEFAIDQVTVEGYPFNDETEKGSVKQFVEGAEKGVNTAVVYDYGTNVVLKAIPAEGYHFVKWSDETTNADHKVINVKKDIELIAFFAINVYEVSSEPNFYKWGKVTITGADGKPRTSFEHGEKVTLKAEAYDGHKFVYWRKVKGLDINNPDKLEFLDEVKYTANPLTFTAKEGVSYVAFFTGDGTDYDDLAGFGLAEGETTGIAGAKADVANGEAYDLQGRRVNDTTKAGVYVIGGKKVVKK